MDKNNDNQHTKMVKLGTFSEYTPKGNSYDATDENLNYNGVKPSEKTSEEDTKKKEE